jgi:hypothetical protein
VAGTVVVNKRMSAELVGDYTSLIVQSTIAPITFLWVTCFVVFHIRLDSWKETLQSKFVVLSTAMALAYGWQTLARIVIAIPIVFPSTLQNMVVFNDTALIVSYVFFSTVGSLSHLRMLFLRSVPVVSNEKLVFLLKVLVTISTLSIVAHFIHFLIYVSFYFNDAMFFAGYADGAILDGAALLCVDFLSLLIFASYWFQRGRTLSPNQKYVTNRPDEKISIISSYGICITVISSGFLFLVSYGLRSYTAPLGCLMSIFWMTMKLHLLFLKHRIKNTMKFDPESLVLPKLTSKHDDQEDKAIPFLETGKFLASYNSSTEKNTLTIRETANSDSIHSRNKLLS